MFLDPNPNIPNFLNPNHVLNTLISPLYARSADSRGYGIPRPQCFTLWPRISLRSALTSSLLEIAGKKASLRASYIIPIRELTPGTVFCRYCHYIWSDIPKPVYSIWEYRFAIVSRMRTLWFHASILGHTYSSISSLGPQYASR